MTTQNGGPFHDGERAVQARAGVAEKAAAIGARMVRDHMTEQHRLFFAAQPLLTVGLLDGGGRPWATYCVGAPGFVQSADPHTLRVGAPALLAEALGATPVDGAKIGLLGIEPATRRRNRMNGIIDAAGADGFSVRVEQSFGNCPQYIQRRELRWHDEMPAVLEHGAGLGARGAEILQRADTFFIASRSRALSGSSNSGVDVSHRGGRPGFVRVDGGKLLFPDFAGNRFFNTLGNIEDDGRVGLTSTDFSSGDSVLLTGRARIVWDSDALHGFAAAERLIEVEIDTAVTASALLPLRGALLEPAPQLADTGAWGETV